MAKPILDLLDRLERKDPKKCNSGCIHYRFDHLERACILSEVYSVKKGEPCYIYEAKKEQAG